MRLAARRRPVVLLTTLLVAGWVGPESARAEIGCGDAEPVLLDAWRAGLLEAASELARASALRGEPADFEAWQTGPETWLEHRPELWDVDLLAEWSPGGLGSTSARAAVRRSQALMRLGAEEQALAFLAARRKSGKNHWTERLLHGVLLAHTANAPGEPEGWQAVADDAEDVLRGDVSGLQRHRALLIVALALRRADHAEAAQEVLAAVPLASPVGPAAAVVMAWIHLAEERPRRALGVLRALRWAGHEEGVGLERVSIRVHALHQLGRVSEARTLARRYIDTLDPAFRRPDDDDREAAPAPADAPAGEGGGHELAGEALVLVSEAVQMATPAGELAPSDLQTVRLARRRTTAELQALRAACSERQRPVSERLERLYAERGRRLEEFRVILQARWRRSLADLGRRELVRLRWYVAETHRFRAEAGLARAGEGRQCDGNTDCGPNRRCIDSECVLEHEVTHEDAFAWPVPPAELWRDEWWSVTAGGTPDDT